ncbi:MAG: hypothetical protein PHY45_09705 [Rhodocyclaceae bacterium]|nr:hypothetical protein [Rhodocyclaceae bacterium]
MRVLFVENKQATLFWEKVAERLNLDGHQIAWIVQNHTFKPRVGSVYVIPYPSRSQLDPDDTVTSRWDQIVRSDRNINYYRGNPHHYRYYAHEIERILDAESPHVVFGEATLFHELLCVEYCRQRNIPYLNPEVARYPAGRFVFYRYDSVEPFGGSGEPLTDADALSLAYGIGQRKAKVGSLWNDPVRFQRLRQAYNLMLMFWSRFQGESYNTPSLLTRIANNRSLAKSRERWDSIAVKRHVHNKGGFSLLYPLHMAPEASIDVRGNAYRDQTKLIGDILAATDGNTRIVVKPNPFSKYEMCTGLIDLVESSDRLVPVPHARNMGDVFPAIDAIVTVVGTVSIEAVFAGKPVGTLVRTGFNKVPACRFLRLPSEVAELVDDVREQRFPRANNAEWIMLAKWLVQTSYPGLVANPFSIPQSIFPDNVARVHAGFCDVINNLATPQRKTPEVQPER